MRVSHGVIDVEAVVVQEPVAPRVEVVGIAEPLDRERHPPRQTDVVSPRGDGLTSYQTKTAACLSLIKDAMVPSRTCWWRGGGL